MLHNCPHSFFRPTPSLAPSSELEEGGREEGEAICRDANKKVLLSSSSFCQGKKSWRSV